VEFLVLIVVIALVAVGAVVGLLTRRPSRRVPPPRSTVRPGVGDDAEVPRDTPTKTVTTVDLPDDLAVLDPIPSREVTGETRTEVPFTAAGHRDDALDVPDATAGRLTRLRHRLSRSQTSLGRGLFALLTRENLDEDTWEEIEDTLLGADVGVASTQEIVERLRTRVKVLGTRSQGDVRQLLREELVAALGDYDRTLKTLPDADGPAVVLVVGVNGTGKTTTCGKLARVLVADGRSVVLGAADTFRAAAADQLETWGTRVGVPTDRGPEGGDPASVAYDAVRAGIELEADVVLVDTAGRLQNKVGLMDELGKVKRVIERHGPLDEVLLVLDATTGQNGLTQARVFAQAVAVTGIVLTKLDGTAKGGIVVAVQQELGVPVKLVGLGEGPDDLAPFDPAAFVDALLGD
jgi:fused signal recognition particle receptor